MRASILFASLALGLHPAAAAQTPALRSLDPVELCNGTETPGHDDWTTTHEGFSYRFATAANRTKFVADPTRYAIQMGGACARMGPASGGGDPDRFLVHDGRIYVFASDGCRDGFAKRPDSFLDPDDPVPQPAGEEAAAGEALLQRAIVAHGGRERLAAWRTYRHSYEVRQKDTTERFELCLELPQRVRVDHDYLQADKSWRYAQMLDGDRGAFVDDGKPRAMPDAARRDLHRRVLREPLFALRTASSGDHTAVARGQREVLGVQVDEVELWQHACSVILGLDAEGRVRTARFRGRGPGYWFGAVELRYDDFVEAGGLRIARKVTATFEGKEAPSLSTERREVAVDDELPADTFRALETR